jgi:hypothetical protein
MRKAGLLGQPIARIGRTDLYSDKQRRDAELAGLGGHQAEGEA